MQRRRFITLVAGVAFARSRIAQASERKRVGVLMSTAATDPRERAAVTAFVEALAKLARADEVIE
jgi:hypothetical protein